MNTLTGSIGGSSKDEEVESTDMESRKMVLMNLGENDLVDTAREGKGGMNRKIALAYIHYACKTVSGKLLSNTGSPVWCPVLT